MGINTSMALTTIQITQLQKELASTYASHGTISYDGKRVITLIVNSDDRTYRKGLLTQIFKQYAAQPWSAKYSPQGSKTGSVKMGNIEVQVKGAAQAAKPAFKPIDIDPKIVNVWLDSGTMKNNVLTYINKLDIPEGEKYSIIKLVTDTAKNTALRMPLGDINPKLVPSEFYEILTALKMAVCLESNDRTIKDILGIQQSRDTSRDKIKIKIPLQANFPLVDYFITLSDNLDDDSAIKISVKSKVNSAKSNTVKFRDMFNNTRAPTQWWDELSAAEKPKQKGQLLIAKGVMKAYEMAGGRTNPRAPVLALINLISQDRAKIEPVLSQKFGIRNSMLFLHALEKINAGMSVTRGNVSLLSTEIGLTNEEQDLVVSIVKNNIDKEGILPELVPFCYVCEKIVVESSRKTSSSKYNFYQMFYDEVLTRQHVAYAISSVSGGSLVYNFYTLVNWAQEYRTWIELRTKNSPGGLNDVIGLDV